MPRRRTSREEDRKRIFELGCSRLDSEEAIRKRKESPEYKKLKVECDTRLKIQNEIKRMAKEGKGKIEIITYLMDVYPYPEFTKYYGSWIDYRFKKLKIKENSDEGKEHE